MKAKLIRMAIDEYVPKTFFRGECENFQLQHIMAEIEELERLASYQVPMQVKVQQYMPVKCTKCEHELNEHITDGYYRVDEVGFCPNCGQALKW